MEINEMQLQRGSEELRTVLHGCLNSNNTTIKQSEQELMRISNHPHFVNQLCYLIPSADKHMKSIINTTLKNYLMARYNSSDNPIPYHQKQFLKQNIFKIFYQIYPESAPIKIYKEIMHIMILVDYPWQGLSEIIDNDLSGSVIASVYFFRQVAKANEYVPPGQQRKNFEQFIIQYFPRIEDIVEKIFQNYNEQTGELLFEALKMFYSAFHIEIPYYLRNFNSLDRWMLFFETILNVPSDPVSLKNQEMAARIYLKFFILYANDGQDGKEYAGWANQFRGKYCSRIFQHVINLIGERKGNEDILSNLINCLYQVVKKPHLRELFTNQHCEVLLYGNCLLPLCQSSNTELGLFKDDPIEYVHRGEDLTCEPLRRSILDLIEIIAECLSFNNKSEMMRIVEYSASVLQSSVSDPEKEVILRVLSKIGKLILKNKFLKSSFQNLTVQYFIPLLVNENPLLNSLTCQLLSLYLPFGELDNQTVNKLMELIYEKIANNTFMVIKYNAILAFTALLNHRAALEAAAPHFSKILEIYVSMLNSFEHENLLACLQSIVRHFSAEVVAYAPELISHLIHLFGSLCKTAENQEEDDEPDSNSPATAALSTISQILSCKLSDEVYHKVSKDLTELFQGIFGTYEGYFDAILSLFNVLVHQANSIIDFNYPYAACRKLLEGDNNLLSCANLPHDITEELRNVAQADSEFEEEIVSILKNLIQKMPVDILKRYPYPSHPQLILCLIQNKKLTMEEIYRLNTSQVDKAWLPYITSYTYMIYGAGQLTNPANIRPIIGVSFYPWLKAQLHPDLVRLIVNAVEVQEQEDDDLYEENTAQLLQKYANEEEEQEYDFNQGSGISYSYLYESPFDSTKDKEILVQSLKSMSQENALAFANSLSNKYRKKLQSLFN